MTSSVVLEDARPRLGQGVVGIAVRVIVAITILMAANMVGAGFVGLVSLIPAASEIFGGGSPWSFALALVQQALVFGFVVLALVLWMRWVERSRLRVIGWRLNRRGWGALMLAIPVTAALVFGLVAALGWMGSTGPSHAALDQPVPTLITSVLLVGYYLGLAFLQQGIPEELLFRGWLLWSMRARPVMAIIVTTLSFTLIHLVSQGGQQSPLDHVLYLAVPLGFSLLAVGMMLWTQSFWASVGVHGGFHIGNNLGILLLAPVDAATSWVTIGAVQALAGIVLIVTAFRRGRRLPLGEHAQS